MRLLRSAAIGFAMAALLAAAPPSAPAAGTWESRQVAVGGRPGDGLFGIACPAASLCVAVGSRGTIVTSTNPTGGSAAWRSGTVQSGSYVGTSAGEPDRTSPGTFQAVSCPTARMCGAVTYAGDFYASTDPTGGASTWHATDLDGNEGDTHLKGLSCPTTTLCVAVAAGGSTGLGPGGKVIGVGLPFAAFPDVSQVQLDESLDLQAVSCTGPSFCLAVARLGRVVTGAAPGSGGPSWRSLGAPGGTADLEAVTCLAARLCLAGDARGNVLSSPDANAATPHWSEAGTGPSVPITDISCPSQSRCAAVDNNGDVIVSGDPTGPTGSWAATNLIPYSGGGDDSPLNALFGLSCPSIELCVAVGADGLIFTSQEPFKAEKDDGDSGGARRGPRRPRLRILRGDHFNRQARTKGTGSRVTFRLRPFGRAQGFLCRLDRHRFHRCRSPLRIYAHLGVHTLRARAIGVGGLRGPVAKARFTIKLAAGQ